MAQECNGGVIIGYNTVSGDDPQPLYAAGSSRIACVIPIEALATASIQKAIFGDIGSIGSGGSCEGSADGVGLPGMNFTSSVVKCGYSATSGQAYIVHNIEIFGRKGTA